ncbi:jg26959 [Pararge aegeria aegeria]|uniref:Jg26959 protein n=1 Tax=Pararge aegeria aegeria TaxID=348720 RepID=A0A8S4RW12_9NEOP|nr:jg26959 [Pararge aegeria aegeria]
MFSKTTNYRDDEDVMISEEFYTGKHRSNTGYKVPLCDLPESYQTGINKVKRYLTPEQLLTLYQAQVRSCMEYCSHLWDGSAKYKLEPLDSVDRRARRLIGNDLVVSGLQSLEHRRKVACLAVFYKIHFGECTQVKPFDLVKPSLFYHRTASYRKNLHRYVVEIPSTRTKRFASSFLIRTAKAWNAHSSSVFPDTYNLGTFKSRVNRQLLGKRTSS